MKLGMHIATITSPGRGVLDEVLATPGHTPEHVSSMADDTSPPAEPLLLLFRVLGAYNVAFGFVGIGVQHVAPVGVVADTPAIKLAK